MDNVTIFAEFSFDAAHSLECFGPNHKCANPHGHTYHVRVELTKPVDEFVDGGANYIVDYAEIQECWNERCKPLLDHQDINPLFRRDGRESTSENIAVWIASRMNAALADLVTRVEVRETAKYGAIWTRG